MNEITNKVDIKELITNEFINDPVYRLALINNLEHDLFTNEILAMHHEISYSTVEAGKIIGRADSTIRNHFRSDLYEYINPEKYGKYYRLNFKSVFKLHMIFLLMEKTGKTSMDILAELGLLPISTADDMSFHKESKGNGVRVINGDSDETDERLISLEKAAELQDINSQVMFAMLNRVGYEKQLSDIDRRIDGLQRDIKDVRSEAYQVYLEEKNTQLLATSLRKTVQKPSLLSLFKKSSEPDVDIVALEKEIGQKLKDKMNAESESKIKKLEEEIAKYREEENIIKLLLESENKKLIQLGYDQSPSTKLLDNSTN